MKGLGIHSPSIGNLYAGSAAGSMRTLLPTKQGGGQQRPGSNVPANRYLEKVGKVDLSSAQPAESRRGEHRAHRLDLSDYETVDLLFCKVGDLQYGQRGRPRRALQRHQRLRPVHGRKQCRGADDRGAHHSAPPAAAARRWTTVKGPARGRVDPATLWRRAGGGVLPNRPWNGRRAQNRSFHSELTKQPFWPGSFRLGWRRPGRR